MITSKQISGNRDRACFFFLLEGTSVSTNIEKRMIGIRRCSGHPIVTNKKSNHNKMKQFILVIMSLLTFSCSSKAQKQTTDTGMQSDKKILVAYFSCTGTTEKVAGAIAQAVNGKLYRITPAVAYTSADLNWNNKASRSSVEMADENSRPALGGGTLNLKDYDVVFLGYPIWWDLCPRPVNTFLEKYDFSGKAVIPFATSGGSSITGSVKQLKALYPQIEWQAGQLCNGNAKQAGDWAKRVISVE